jgi:UDP-N-acetyl-D-glucosamine dehydrogenase
LNTVRKAINGSRIHLFGVAYKRDVNDSRESPALDIMQLLIQRGADVSYTDPFIGAVTQGERRFEHIPFNQVGPNIDCAVIATDHTEFDYARIAQFPLVVDTRNALKSFDSPTIFRL